MKYLRRAIVLSIAFSLLLAMGALAADTSGWRDSEPEDDLEEGPSVARAGLRNSRWGFWDNVAGDLYPVDETWWIESAENMARRFKKAAPAMVLIVAEVQYIGDNPDHVDMFFPDPGNAPAFVHFDIYSDPGFHKQLNEFDAAEGKVWLEIEPGAADRDEVLTLIDLVYDEYGYHPCVVGISIDSEYYRWHPSGPYPQGKPVADDEASAWLDHVKSKNPAYKMFLKHWEASHMPPGFRHPDLIFVSDWQAFKGDPQNNESPLQQLVRIFKEWGDHFSGSDVGFQIGYDSDSWWWNHLKKPQKKIGRAILKAVPNCTDLYWVDFTALEVWEYDYKQGFPQ